MNIIQVENVKPLRIGTKSNIIVCQRIETAQKLSSLSEQLRNDVKDKKNEEWLLPNTIYAVFRRGMWNRGIMKYQMGDITCVQLVDSDGTFNFSEVIVRKITDTTLCNYDFCQIKFFVYGIGIYDHDEEFVSIFEQLLKGKEILAIFGLIERKPHRVHECFAGDFLFKVNGQLKSFREVLIRERITYPSHVQERLNQMIFQRRAEIISGHRTLNTFRRSTANSEQQQVDAIEVIGERFKICELIREGSVSIFFY